MTTKATSFFSVSIPIIAVVLGSVVLFQDGKKDNKPTKGGVDGDGAMYVPPRPTPEHEMLRKCVGVWDSTCTKDGETPATKGVETNTALGEYSVVSDFRMPMNGMPFVGHGVVGYSIAKKKFYQSWSDSMSPEITIFEGDYNKDKKILTMMGTCMKEGKTTILKSTCEEANEDTKIFKMYTLDGGKETLDFTIVYNRRK